MSALGQKQTYAAQKAMSALPPKADMCGAMRDARFGPKADIGVLDSRAKKSLHRGAVASFRNALELDEAIYPDRLASFL